MTLISIFIAWLCITITGWWFQPPGKIMKVSWEGLSHVYEMESHSPAMFQTTNQILGEWCLNGPENSFASWFFPFLSSSYLHDRPISDFIGTKSSHVMGIQKKSEDRLPGNVQYGAPQVMWMFVSLNPMNIIVIQLWPFTSYNWL